MSMVLMPWGPMQAMSTQDGRLFDSQNDAPPPVYRPIPDTQFGLSEGRDEFDRHAVYKALRMHKLPGSNLAGEESKGLQLSSLQQEAPRSPEGSDASSADVPERCQSPDVPSQAAACLDIAHGAQTSVLPAAVVSSACLHALLGSTAVIPQLLQGDVCTSSIRPLALQRLVQPICSAGVLRAQLEAFVQHHGSPALHVTVDATQHAFVQAVAAVLSHQTRTLQQIMSSIEQRRETENPVPDDDELPAAQIPPTPLEILQHSRQLRQQLRSLAHLCWCYAPSGHSGTVLRWQIEAFPKGNALLDWLFSGAQKSIRL
jgi:hypothetical protein